MKRLRETNDVYRESAKEIKLDKALESTVLTSQGDLVFNILFFLNGRDLNRARLVCSLWYKTIYSDYFTRVHCQNLKIIHNQFITQEKKIQVKRVFMFLGLKQGEELTYYKQKNNASDIKELPLKFSVFYKDGLKHGKSIHYFKNGIFSFEGHFHEGKKHGRFVEVFKERPDLIKTECFYLDNKLHGKLVEYVLIKDKSSTNNWKRIKKHECEYDRGKLHGTKLEYDGKTEQIVRHIDYDHQKFHGKYIRYYQDGKKEYECELAQGKKHGTETRYYRDGIYPCEIRQYKNGKLIHSQTL